MKPLLFLFLTGILCACTLSEQADMEINPKPTLVVEYRYTDKKGNNTTHEEVGHMASLLFDPTGVFLREITAFGERFTDSMALRSEEETIAEISLSDYLVRYGERIDYHCGKEVIIPIHIDVTSSEITVTVSDWDEGKVQIPVLGK